MDLKMSFVGHKYCVDVDCSYIDATKPKRKIPSDTGFGFLGIVPK